MFLGDERMMVLSCRPEQSLWQRHGRARGGTDAPELLAAAPPGPHRSLQSSRTQPHHGERAAARGQEQFGGKTTGFALLSRSFLLSGLPKLSLLPSI